METSSSAHASSDYIDLSQCWKALKRNCLPAILVASTVIGAVGLATSVQTPIYEAEGKLLFNKNNRTSSLSGLASEVSELSSVTQQGSPLDTQAEVIRSVPLLEQTINSLKLVDQKGRPLTKESLLGNLKIKAIRGTDVLALSYRSTDAKQAAAVINKLMALYLENDVVTNRAEAKAARVFITEQLPAVEARVAAGEAKLRQFQERHGIVSLEEEAKSAIEVVGTIEKQLAENQSALAEANRRSRVLQEQVGLASKDAVALSNLNQSQEVQKTLAAYREVQNQLAVERVTYRDDAPAIAHLLRKEAVLQQQLQTRVAQALGSLQSVPDTALQIGSTKQELAKDLVRSEADRLGLQDRVAALSQVYTAYRQRLQIVPKLEQTQRQLQREMKAAQSTYEQLLTKLQEVQVVENQSVGNAKIMSQSIAPTRAIAPQPARNLALGSFLGLALGTATALLLDSRDKSIRSVEDAEQTLGYSPLGRIPEYATADASEGATTQELPVRDNPYSSASAAYEMLQATLDFALPDQALRRIVVTSALPGEGKSSVSANLAVAMAQMGRRVLLVDADLRRPRQHQIWQIPNLVGLSDVLVGRAEFSSTVREVLVNVDLICCGTIPPNPSALLTSNRMATLMQEWSEHYDCVVIDTPPVTLFPDALKLGKQVDGVLPVIRPGLLQTHAALHMKRLLLQAAQNVLGIVVNGTNSENDSSGYYYQNSYYYRNGKPEKPEANLLLAKMQPRSRQS